MATRLADWPKITIFTGQLMFGMAVLTLYRPVSDTFSRLWGSEKELVQNGRLLCQTSSRRFYPAIGLDRDGQKRPQNAHTLPRKWTRSHTTALYLANQAKKLACLANFNFIFGQMSSFCYLCG